MIAKMIVMHGDKVLAVKAADFYSFLTFAF